MQPFTAPLVSVHDIEESPEQLLPLSQEGQPESDSSLHSDFIFVFVYFWPTDNLTVFQYKKKKIHMNKKAQFCTLS